MLLETMNQTLLTGFAPFVEDPSDEEILNWIIQVHADEKRLNEVYSVLLK